MPSFTVTRRGSRRHTIAVIDGPNMSSLGARSKKVYGDIGSLDELKTYVRDYGDALGVEVESFSSNHQGDILEFIHESAARVDGYLPRLKSTDPATGTRAKTFSWDTN